MRKQLSEEVQEAVTKSQQILRDKEDEAAQQLDEVSKEQAYLGEVNEFKSQRIFTVFQRCPGNKERSLRFQQGYRSKGQRGGQGAEKDK